MIIVCTLCHSSENGTLLSSPETPGYGQAAGMSFKKLNRQVKLHTEFTRHLFRFCRDGFREDLHKPSCDPSPLKEPCLCSWGFRVGVAILGGC